MSRSSIWDYKFKRFTVRRSYTDAMYSWSMEVDQDYPTPPIWQPIEAVKSIGDQKHCILLGFPVTKRYTRNNSERGTEVSGFSYGFYVSHRPIRPENRLLSSSVSGSTIIIENPLDYCSRLIHGTDNPCGLLKGGWDASIAGWGSTLPYQQFESTDSSTVQNVVDDICEYGGLLYLDGWKEINGIFQPVTYLRADSALDTGFDLPAPILINASDDQYDIRDGRVMVDSEAEINGEKWYNSVWVDGVIQGTLKGFSARKPASWNTSTMGAELPYQYCFQMPPTVSEAAAQQMVSAKCNYLSSLLTLPAETFSVKFFNRYDLKLMQRIQFSGFMTIPDTPMRIVDIEYSIDGTSGCVCTCSCASERSWSSSRKLSLSLKQDWGAVADTIQRSVESKTRQVVYGTAVANGPSGTTIMQSPRSGALAYVTLPNQ